MDSDLQLVRDTLIDPESYRHIINRYRERLMRYIGHLGVRDTAQQEDILQEVFIKVYRNLNGYNELFPFSSWIYRITHNETMTFFRKKKIQPLSLESFPYPDFLLSDSTDQEISFPLERIPEVLNMLNQKYKDVIVLKYFEDKSYDEIADILQKPPGTIAILLHRAKQKLTVLLEPYLYE